MKIEIITPSLTRSSGGVGKVVVDVYSNIAKRNPDTIIELNSLNYEDESLYHANDDLKNLSSKIYNAIPPKRLGFSPRLVKNAFSHESSLVHLHGIWMATTLYGNIAKFSNRTPTIISPHGMLNPWILSRGPLLKKTLKFLYEGYSWNKANAFHALNTQEADAILKVLPNANIHIIPNGIDIPDTNLYLQKNAAEITLITYLGRLHEKKNILGLIEAINNISQIDYDKSPFILNIAGWGEPEYEALVINTIKGSKSERFNFVGPIFGNDKDSLLKNSDAFILPSFSEGLPLTILESWSYGIPVLMSKHCNLTDAIEEGIAIDTGTDVKDITNSITKFLNLSGKEKSDLSQASYDYVKSKYNWETVCDQYMELYRMYGL
ncbi:glycosyltransferase [Pseudocolwellia sp. HL-MZ7]|uniref:glycosyltransferase n=1 Tax=Pseudocolwellia sp. HL-MZ7 TaxID=3400627 RepID=UPI003CEF53CF